MNDQRLIVCTTDYLRPGDEVDQRLREAGYLTRHAPSGDDTSADVVERLDGATGALVGNEPLTADTLARLPGLRAVVRTGVGYDSIDVDAATRLGISVSNLPGVNANAVAEYTLGLILSAARHLTTNAADVRIGQWPRHDGRELRGATLGVIGHGAAGRRTIALATALGMRVVCHTTHPPTAAGASVQFVSLDTLLAESDFVSLHTSLTPATRGLLDADAFAKMKRGAVIINTSRGPVVDEGALIDAVAAGHVAGAELDVVDHEPLPADSPLRNHAAIRIYPHMAGQTAEARRAAGLEGAKEIIATLDGNAQHSLNAHLPGFGNR